MLTRTDPASASASSAVASELRQVNSALNKISGQIGATYKNASLIGRMDQVVKNTYEVCKDASSSAFCKY